MIFLIIGVAGAIGSGKSFTQFKHGLDYCEKRQKQLVTNFPINIDAVYRYAISPKILDSPFGSLRLELIKLWRILIYQIEIAFYYLKIIKKIPQLKNSFSPRLPWVAKLCKDGGIIQIYNPEKLEALMIPESVVLLDEAGILLNSREFKNTSKKLLADLAQSRKDGVDLMWCAQFDDQVDYQFRMLTQFWIHCQSLSAYDKKMRRPKLLIKQIFWFRCSDYQRWLSDPTAQGNYFKTRFAYSMQSEEGPLSRADLKIFECFDSFARLDTQSSFNQTKSFSKIITFFKCNLPKDYYFERLEDYKTEADPLSKYYQPLYGYWIEVKSSSTLPAFSEYQPQIQTQNSKSILIRQALEISRKKRISAPMFKSMSEANIQDWIRSHSY